MYIANHEDYSFSALQLCLRYNPNELELISISKDSGLIRNWELFDWNTATTGAVPVAMGGIETKISYEEGELFRCTFVVSEEEHIYSA